MKQYNIAANNRKNGITERQQQNQQFIENFNLSEKIEGRKNANQKQINNSQHQYMTKAKIEKCLIIVCVLFTCFAFIFHFYVINMKEKAINQKIQWQTDKEKWSKIYKDNFFRYYNKYKYRKTINPQQNKQKYQYQYQEPNKIKELISQLQDKKCKQIRQVWPKQSILHQEQQPELILHQPQIDPSKNNNISGSTAAIPYQPSQTKPSPDQKLPTVAGISQTQVLKSKQLDSLTLADPWETSPLATQQYQYYQQKYSLSKYPIQLPFCIVVPTFNNKQNDRYRRNIDSILQQNYTNYRVFVIDDGSDDGTGDLVQNRVTDIMGQYGKTGKQVHVEVKRNEKQLRAMGNLRNAALQLCRSHEIFVVVDGDDRLIGRNVFKLYNARFQETKAWFVYSNFISFVGAVGFSRQFKQQVIKQNRYRRANFVTSHLRAFYTQLFRLVKQQDLKNDIGQYFRAANDVAICIPILEMCHTRVSYIPEITYLYNSNTGLNNHLVRIRQQIDNTRLVRKRKSYLPLAELQFS